MKKLIIVIILLVISIPVIVFAKPGCCSHHGGVAGCAGAKQLCNDGTLSPTCYCEIAYSDNVNYTKNYTSNYSSYNANTQSDDEDDYSNIGILVVITISVLALIGAKSK